MELPTGGTAWLVTRMADAQAVLSDPRFSNNSARDGYPVLQPGQALSADERTPIFVEMDEPEHTTYRRMLIPEFTVRRAKEMRPEIQGQAEELVDQMLANGSSADLVQTYSLALPSLVICGLLGVPYEDRDFFQSRVSAAVSLASSPADFEAAFADIVEYIGKLVAEKMDNPTDDVIGRLVTGPMADGKLDHERLSSIGALLLAGGHESTANMISLGIAHLITAPELRETLRQQPERYPDVVEELLRYHSIADVNVTRVALADVEVGGRLIRAGEGVAVSLGSADHDESVFAEPAGFDIDRRNKRHIAFGHGYHQCLGMSLARVELEIAYRTIFDKIPNLRLDVPLEELPFKYNGMLFGLHALPVSW
ncbi:cytochrome P450 [Kutzneria sp. CA-103260]|uniref:cytochrome P450 n=1 Tax=Kutzneria sp. CA-103260 TaxID=2802641 RepID=UPI001BA652B1|nr:cytochrome P450 [Kutzneria sp. CA-103260]